MLIRKILSFLIALLFLLSATGVYYVKHTCLHSRETSIILGEKHNCCEHTDLNKSCYETNAAEGTCPVHGNHNNCCENQVVYLKSDSEFKKPETFNPANLFDYQLTEVAMHHMVASAEHVQVKLPETPSFKTPRDVLIKNNILIL